jgi:hypothetical protein
MARSFNAGAHDAYKELLWILSLPEINKPSTESIPSHPTFADFYSQMNIYHRWYKMIEGFAGRELTYDTDKLPAISGLANKIQQVTGDVYMAGLWKKDIAAGLCWGARFNEDVIRPLTYIAPSWSWASTKGNITYQFVGKEVEYKYEIDLVSFELATEPLNPLGQVFSGSITVSVPMRKFDMTKNTVHIEKEWDDEAEKSKPKVVNNNKVKKDGRVHQYPLKDQNHVVDPLQSGLCRVSFDTGPPGKAAEVWLLRMVVTGGDMSKKPDYKLIPDGIVVEKMVEGDGMYRRLGIYACEDAMEESRESSECPALLGWEQRTITII